MKRIILKTLTLILVAGICFAGSGEVVPHRFRVVGNETVSDFPLTIYNNLGLGNSGVIESSIFFSTLNNPDATVITAPSTDIIHICEEADKGFNWLGSFTPPPLGGPVVAFHSGNQVRNETAVLGFFEGADPKLFGILGFDGDDIDGIAKAEKGVEFELKAGDGGSLAPGGKGGDVRLKTGHALTGNNNGGDVVLRFGSGFGAGRQGVITTETPGDMRFKNSGSGVFRIEDSSSSSALTLDHDGTDALYSTTTGRHKFSQKLFIDSPAGNTTNVDALVIQNAGGEDHVKIKKTGSTGIAEMIIDNAGPCVACDASLTFQAAGVDKWSVGQDIGSTTDKHFAIVEGTQSLANTRFFIEPGGDIGIGGVTSPLAKLHIKETTVNQGLIVEDNDSSAFAEFAMDGALPNAQLFIRNQNGDIRFLTTTERMRITNAGNVGIGTNAPTANLEIEYNNTLSTVPAFIIDNPNGVGQDVIDFSFVGVPQARIRKSNTGGLFINTLDLTQIELWTANNPRFVVLANGNVGINTQLPVSMLHVNGSQTVKRVASAGNYTILDSDFYVGITNTAAPRTVNLPSATVVGAGKVYHIKDESGGASPINPITIDPSGTQTIDGALTEAIDANYGKVSLISDGANWFTF